FPPPSAFAAFFVCDFGVAGLSPLDVLPLAARLNRPDAAPKRGPVDVDELPALLVLADPAPGLADDEGDKEDVEEPVGFAGLGSLPGRNRLVSPPSAPP